MHRISTSLVIVFVLIVGIAGGALRYAYESFSGIGNGYAAIVLSTNDIYFAKVTDMNSEYVTLQDIYYPQLDQQTGTTNNPDIRLIKFGSEFHGPVDLMKVNRDHVVMIQPLRDDSQVVKTIADYQAKNQ